MHHGTHSEFCLLALIGLNFNDNNVANQASSNCFSFKLLRFVMTLNCEMVSLCSLIKKVVLS